MPPSLEAGTAAAPACSSDPAGGHIERARALAVASGPRAPLGSSSRQQGIFSYDPTWTPGAASSWRRGAAVLPRAGPEGGCRAANRVWKHGTVGRDPGLSDAHRPGHQMDAHTSSSVRIRGLADRRAATVAPRGAPATSTRERVVILAARAAERSGSSPRSGTSRLLQLASFVGLRELPLFRRDHQRAAWPWAPAVCNRAAVHLRR
jgi:hypothetical protein